MKDWQQIRHERRDLTDWVVHLTKNSSPGPAFRWAIQCLAQILKDGFIKPTFAPLPNRYSSKERATVKGPYPAICFTEQPLWALVQMKNIFLWNERYSSYGIAFHKSTLHTLGARPVIYGGHELLGKRISEDHKLYEEGKEIYEGGIPIDHQYRWCIYEPASPNGAGYPADFTWEREWRMRIKDGSGLPICPIIGSEHVAIIVERDKDVEQFQKLLRNLAKKCRQVSNLEQRIISLETAEGKLNDGHEEYGRIDTWPFTIPHEQSE